jgi:predicted nucleic acid-binding protein
MTAAEALYVALAEQLHAAVLTDDRNLVAARTFPAGITVFHLPT